MTFLATVCFGLLVAFVCPDPKQPAVVDSFCQVAGPDIAKFKALSAAEIAALGRPRKEAIAALRRSYKKLCEVKP